MEIGEAVGDDAVMDPHLAQIADVSFAFGQRDDVKALASELTPEAIERVRAAFKNAGLSDEAIRWLAVGRQGASSRAAFYHLVGIKPPHMDAGDTRAYPRDEADMKRVIDLIDQVPEARGRLGEMRTVSEEWSRAIDQHLSEESGLVKGDAGNDKGYKPGV